MDLSELIPDGSKDLNKQDILQLLQTGLKENQPFARYFADTVLADIQRKLKDLKIQSTAIEIDGKDISKDINNSIREGLEKDIDSTVELIRKEIKSSGSDIAKSSKKNPLSLDSILGQTPQMSLITRMKFQGLTRSILDRVKKGLPEKIDLLSSPAGLKLNDLFAPPGDKTYPLQGIKFAWEWNNLRKTLIERVKSSIPKKIDLGSSSSLKLSDIFTPPGDKLYPLQSVKLAWQFNSLRRDILSKIKPPKTEINLTGEHLKLSDIFAPPGDSNYPMQGTKIAWDWNKKRKDILAKILPPSKPIELTEEHLKLDSIFTPPGDNIYPLQGARLAWDWNKKRRQILQSIIPSSTPIELTAENINLNSIFAPPKDKLYPLQGVKLAWDWNTKKQSILKNIKVPDTLSLKRGSFTLSDIMGETPASSLLTKLRWNKLQRNIIDKIQKRVDQPREKQNRDEQGRYTRKEPPTVKPVLETKVSNTPKEFKSLEEKEQMVRVSGFTRNAIIDLSKLPGLEKIKRVTTPAKKEKVDDAMPGWLKALAVAGPAIIAGGLVVGVKGLFDSGPFKGLEKVISRAALAIGPKITKYTSGIIVKHLDTIAEGFTKKIGNMFKVFGLDMTKTLGLSTVGRMIKPASMLRGSIGSIVSKLFGKSVLKKLPFGIGAIFGLGFGISRMIDGDMIGGLLDIASGVASIVPGAGTAISIAIDLFSAARDIKTGGAKKAGQTGVNKKINSFITDKLQNNPLIRPFIKLSKALGAFSTGDWKNGIKELAFIIPGVETVVSFFAEAKEEKLASVTIGKPKSLASIMRELVFKKVKKWWKSAPAWMRTLIKATVPGIGAIVGMSGMDEDTAQETMEKNPTAAKPKVKARALTPKEDQKVERNKELLETRKQLNAEVEKIRVAAKKAGLPANGSLKGTVEGKIATQVSIGTKSVDLFKSGLLNKKEMAEVLEFRKKEADSKAAIDRNLKQAQSIKSISDFQLYKKQAPTEAVKIPSMQDTKREQSVLQLVEAMNNSQKQSKKNSQSNEQLHSDITKLVANITNMLAKLATTTTLSNTQNTPAPTPMSQDLAGISDDAGSTRDPAYVLRSRAWDRIRKGYVII